MKFLTTRQIAGEIEGLIRNAENFIILISPYVQIAQLLMDRLQDAEKSGTKIHFVFGKENLASLEADKLKTLQKAKLYYLSNLHAKCYLNDKIAIITSMNLYEYSEQNNREMGLIVTKAENEALYMEISREANSIIQNAEPYALQSKKVTVFNRIERSEFPRAYCIRCGMNIDLNPEKPMCYNCYSVWAEYFNYDYEEEYCHVCGKHAAISMAKPLCYDCFRKRSS